MARRIPAREVAGYSAGSVGTGGFGTLPGLALAYYLTDTLAVNADEIARAEMFGPVVAAIPFEDEAHAVALANDTAYGLAGAVWTGSVDQAHRVAREVRAGTVWINSYKTITVRSPFGGFGDSGYGRSSGRDGLAEYTQAKSVWYETAADAPLPFGY